MQHQPPLPASPRPHPCPDPRRPECHPAREQPPQLPLLLLLYEAGHLIPVLGTMLGPTEVVRSQGEHVRGGGGGGHRTGHGGRLSLVSKGSVTTI